MTKTKTFHVLRAFFFSITTVLSCSRQICEVRRLILKFYREREHRATNLNFLSSVDTAPLNSVPELSLQLSKVKQTDMMTSLLTAVFLCRRMGPTQNTAAKRLL